MALGFGASYNQSNTKSSSTFDKSTTPIIPDWLQGQTNDILGQAGSLAGVDPQSYVAGPNYNIGAANQNAYGLSGTSPGYGEAQQTLKNLIALGNQGAPQVQSASLLDNLGSYMSPYTNDVVNTTLAAFDANAGQTRAQQSLNLARQNAFGGSGAAITQSLTEGELARARATQEAQLRDQAFNTGAGLSNYDAGRRQDASAQNAQLKLANRAQIGGFATGLASLLGAQDANSRANIDTQLNAGQTLQGIQQTQAQAPLDLLSWRAGILNDLNPQMFVGQQEKGTSSSKGKTTGFGLSAKAGA